MKIKARLKEGLKKFCLLSIPLFIAESSLLYFYDEGGYPLFFTIIMILVAVAVFCVLNFKRLSQSNLILMTLLTYLLFPFSLSLSITLLLAQLFRVSFIAILLGVIVFSVIMYFYCLHKNRGDKVYYLEKTKVCFDIIRLIFVIVLTLVSLYSPYLNAFYDFKDLFNYAKDKNLEETRRLFNLTFQATGFPFVITTTLLKIISEYQLMNIKRKKEKMQHGNINCNVIIRNDVY